MKKHKTETVSKPIVIRDKYFVTLDGNQIYHKLDSNINEPLILIDNCQNVTIKNFVLDGNKSEQTSENSRSRGSNIRNNCISINCCQSVIIENCTVTNAISGGIVPAFCDKIIINNCDSSNNYFDGIAVFKSNNVIINNCSIKSNIYSGVSIDGDCKKITVKNSNIDNNKQWGIWFGSNQNGRQISVFNCQMNNNQFGKIGQGGTLIS